MRCPGGILVRRQKHFSYFLSRWKSSSSLQMYEPLILSLSVHRPWRKPVRPELWSTGWKQIIIQLELKSLAFFHLSSPISKLESLSVHMTAGTAPDACTRSLLWDALTLSGWYSSCKVLTAFPASDLKSLILCRLSSRSAEELCRSYFWISAACWRH